jgi:chromodomain-helicase-DNA-binding protein 1
MVNVKAEMDGDRIILRFPFEREAYSIVERTPGRSFVPRERGGPYWTVPRDIAIMRDLRKELGKSLVLDDDVREWAHDMVRREKVLLKVNAASTADLHRLPDVLPELHEFVSSRPYQLADISFMAEAQNPLNANAPGLGKTVECIGAIFEAGLDEGAHLIVAPLTSMEPVWWYELDRWQPHAMLMSLGNQRARHEIIMEAVHMAKVGEPFFLIVNPAQLRGKDAAHLAATNWTTITIDEFHKCGLSNPNTKTSAILKSFKAEKKMALSGTPIGGKVEKLWAVLNWLEPEKFKSKSNWIRTWLNTTVGYGGHLETGGIKRFKLEEFNEFHAQFMVRRLREEVRTELPEKQRIDTWVEMGPEQNEQYQKFAAEAEIRIEEDSLSAIGILAEYTRLRQFAIAKQRLVKERRSHADGTHTESIVPYPTEVSCKLPQVQRILDEHGVFDHDGTEQVIIFSQFSKVIDMMYPWLVSLGVSEDEMECITGATPERERGPIITKFEAGGKTRVLLMTTTAGGMSITLNKSDAIVFMDETWNPDDQTQAEDRNRNNSATIYYIRTFNTIEHYVNATTKDKAEVNYNILDLRRLGVRATGTVEETPIREFRQLMSKKGIDPDAPIDLEDIPVADDIEPGSSADH